MSDIFFGGREYQSQDTRALRSIQESQYPDTDDEFVKTIRRHENELGYISGYLAIMQKGVDAANRNAIEQLQEFIADIIVLLGGGQITSGLELGDLKYILPALGALLGFGDGPFPINLIQAAEHFFLGYVVPSEQFVDVIEDIILDWAAFIGLDEEFIQDLREFFDAVGDLFGTVENMFEQVATLFETLGVTGDNLGPLGDILSEIMRLFEGVDLSGFATIVDVVTDVISPVIDAVTWVINIVNSLLLGIDIPQQWPDSPDALLEIVPQIGPWFGGLKEMFNFLGMTEGESILEVDNWFNIASELLTGQVPSNLLGMVPSSALGEITTNLIRNPIFENLSSIVSSVFSWDQAQSHAATGGSALVVADGSGAKDLLSNLIGVTGGQTMDVSGWVKWTSLIGSGNPIRLGITEYFRDPVTSVLSAVGQPDLVLQANSPPTSDWRQLISSYVVPNTGVNAVRLRLTVAPTATAGSVWWDDMFLGKTQPIFQRLIAGTDPGTFLPDDIENLFGGIISNAMELVNKAGLSEFNSLVSTIGGDIQEGFEDIGERLNSFLDDLSPLNGGNINAGEIADQFVPGIGSLMDTAVTRILNIPSDIFDYGHLATSYESQTFALKDAGANIISLFSRLSHLESQVSAIPPPATPLPPDPGTGSEGAVGVAESDDFERVSSSNLGPTLWIQSYAGGAGIWATPNGHDASWIASGISDRDFLCIRNAGQIRSATDYQRVSAAMGPAATYSLGAGGYNDLWLRISDGSTSLANITGIRCRFGADGSLYIARFVSGSGTLLISKAPGSITPPGPGAQIVGLAGDMPSQAPRVFRILIGVSMRLEAVELGVASGVGAAYRRWGHGGRAEGYLLGQRIPGSLHYWNGMDQTTPPVGSGGALPPGG